MILHIPHSGILTLGRDIEQYDIDYLTDWYTDELFQHPNSDRMVQKHSRFICDVERFNDEEEPMFKIGQGICYTKGTRGNDIKVIEKENLIDTIYIDWHKTLNNLVDSTLNYIPKVVLVDCHSFPDKDGYPDFCIGATKDTPIELVETLTSFISKNYYVEINYPYSGAMYPSDYKGSNVFPIMIEVNKKLYLNGTTKNEDFERIQNFIGEILELISKYELSFDKI